ncbi:hypothetical protein EYF80_053208 [Liparis tanakae]|uniref:Uncharacterized protein n=1 Tax=Liparis tanakae TaxID=230148 RepID=A0A4Z2F6X2_9TELE|nr:hypothetical protein EYF80_053208 [Liparis tanakae]
MTIIYRVEAEALYPECGCASGPGPPRTPVHQDQDLTPQDPPGPRSIRTETSSHSTPQDPGPSGPRPHPTGPRSIRTKTSPHRTPQDPTGPHRTPQDPPGPLSIDSELFSPRNELQEDPVPWSGSGLEEPEESNSRRVHVYLSVCTAHRRAGRRLAGRRVALAQQRGVDPEVLLGARVTDVELQHVSDVTVQSAHQGAVRAQLLETSPGFFSPAALQEENHHTVHSEQWTDATSGISCTMSMMCLKPRAFRGTGWPNMAT